MLFYTFYYISANCYKPILFLYFKGGKKLAKNFLSVDFLDEVDYLKKNRYMEHFFKFYIR